MAHTVWRVRDRASFGALRRSGRRVRRGAVTVTWVPGTAGDPPRVAYSVGRRVGGSVVRNRVRRRLRAATWELRSQLAAGTYLIGTGPGAADLSYGEVRASVSDALAALAAPRPRPTEAAR